MHTGGQTLFYSSWTDLCSAVTAFGSMQMSKHPAGANRAGKKTAADIQQESDNLKTKEMKSLRLQTSPSGNQNVLNP